MEEGLQVVETTTTTCLSRVSKLGNVVRDDLEEWYSETPTDQYTVYNIKMGMFKNSTRVVTSLSHRLIVHEVSRQYENF